MKIDLKNFKKLCSDKDSTTFEHRDGHTLKVAHKGLSPNTLKDMMALGGEAQGVHKAPDKDRPGKSEAGHLVDEKAYEPAKQEHTRVIQENRKINPKLKASGGTIDPRASMMAKGGEQEEFAKGVSQGFNPKSQSTSTPPPPPPPAEESTNQDNSYYPEPASQELQNASTGDPQYAEGTPDTPVGEDSQTQSPDQPQQAVVTDTQPQQEQPTQSLSFSPLPITAKNPNPVMGNLIQPTSPMGAAQFTDDQAAKTENDLLLGHIKPETYKDYMFKDKSFLGKMGTLFGLMIGAGGAGLAHQPNMAFEMMNNDIQRDWDKQKTQMKGAQDLYSMLQKQPEITSVANQNNANAEQIRQTIGLNAKRQATFHYLAQKALSMTDPVQRKNAQQVLAMLYQGNQNAYFNDRDAAVGLQGFQSQGQPQQQTTPLPGALQPQSSTFTPQLIPGAQDVFNSSFMDPTLKQDYPEFVRQFTGMQQADVARQQLHQLMPQMRQHATYAGDISQRIDPRTFAEIGGGLVGVLGLPGGPVGIATGAGVGAGVGGGSAAAVKGGLKALAGKKNIDYNTDVVGWKKLVANALAHTNASPSQVEDIAEKTKGTIWDTDETAAHKLQELDEFIKGKQEKSMLLKKGLVKE